MLNMIRLELRFGKEPFSSLLEAFAYIKDEESCRGAMLHSSSQDWSTLVTASHRTGKGILRVMIAGKQWMRRINCFVITIINHDLLERLVDDFVVALLWVEEVVIVVLLGFGLITLQPLIKILLQVLLLLKVRLVASKNWIPSIS